MRSTLPQVSVVMSVYNSAPTLNETMDSVLSQQGVELEFIVVNDGSTDGSGEILDQHAARDRRVRVLHQSNTGLTAALVRGCREARGELIARQDAGGDISLPGRLAAQCDVLQASPDIAMTSCGTRFVCPDGQFLFDVSQTTEQLAAGLSSLTSGEVKGPSSHPSVMFRRNAYQTAGGYRTIFRVAQDLDLWMRLFEIGKCHAMPDVLYITRLSAGSISSTRRSEQVRTTKALLAAAALRRSGHDDREALLQLTAVEPGPGARSQFSRCLDKARLHYFMGSCLRSRDPDRARAHYNLAFRSCALYPRTWYGLLQSLRLRLG